MNESGLPALEAAELHRLRRQATLRLTRERKRIARNLHDGAQAHLVGIAIGMTRALDARYGPPDELERILLDVREQTSLALGAIRSLCRGLYPAVLRDRGLLPALEQLQATSDGRLQLLADDGARSLRLLPHVEEHLYFFVCEAVTNAWKHGAGGEQDRAVDVTVQLGVEDSALRIRIADDGCGFDTHQTPAGNGLLTMEDRITEFGGRLTVRSAPEVEVGTEVLAQVPLSPALLKARR